MKSICAILMLWMMPLAAQAAPLDPSQLGPAFKPIIVGTLSDKLATIDPMFARFGLMPPFKASPYQLRYFMIWARKVGAYHVVNIMSEKGTHPGEVFVWVELAAKRGSDTHKLLLSYK